MKTNIISLIAIAIIIVSCDPLEDLKDEYTKPAESFNYTLSDDDYGMLADRIMQLNNADSNNANFLRANMFFNDTVKSTNYIPTFLNMTYQGKPTGSSIDVTFNFNDSLPAELTDIVSASTYTIGKKDLEEINQTVDYLGYFAPPFVADHYIPTILKNSVALNDINDTLIVKYKHCNKHTEVNFTNKLNAEFIELLEDGTTGKFSVRDSSGPQSWSLSSANGGSLFIDGYDGENFNNNVDYLISPPIDLSNVKNTHIEIKQAIEYYETGCLFVIVSANYNGSDIAMASWSQYAIPAPNQQGSDVFEIADLINISAFDGKKIHIGFKYVSSVSASKAPFWAISQVRVGNYGYQTIGGGTPILVEDFYQYNTDENIWSKLDNVYKLNSRDYASSGIYADTFYTRNNDPALYLPTIANEIFQLPQEGQELVLVYNYRVNNSVSTMADKLTYISGNWTSSYNYIQPVTEPYKMSGNGTWVFDPTVILDMTKDDFQIIVDHVNNSGLPNGSSFPANTEDYYGASAYWSNFDIVDDGSWNKSVFASWEEAVINGIKDALLPSKYADAVSIVSGVEVFYIVNFDVYPGSRPYKRYSIIFEVTKDAPNPEFGVIEGPLLLQ